MSSVEEHDLGQEAQITAETKKPRKPRGSAPITGYTIRKAFAKFQELCRQGTNVGLEITWTAADDQPLPVQPAGMKIRGYSEY